MSKKVFTKDFTLQEPISQEAVDAAVEVLKTGRLHRYNVMPGEDGHAALLETEFAAYLGKKYCLACSSCGGAMYLALKSAGVKRGDKVLCNAFTLAPVPGALENAGAEMIFVEIEPDNYTISLGDLEAKARASGARFLLLSHMRGHIADMEALTALCDQLGLTVIEDCAHTMGAGWNGRKSGSFGLLACFSTQTYKHLNSGEGGLLVTDDPECIARAIILSGSYMLFDKHLSRPEASVFDDIKLDTPNYSMRMDNLRAAILRVQLRDLDKQCARWNERYRVLEKGLSNTPHLILPQRPGKEQFVASSFQFRLDNATAAQMRRFVKLARERGVTVKWFGEPAPHGFTSSYKTWRYVVPGQSLPQTDAILATLCDIRLPLTFSLQDCEDLAAIIDDTAREALAS